MNMNERNLKIREHNERVEAKLVNRDFPRNKKGEIFGQFKNLTGQTFGRLAVISHAGSTKMVKGQIYFWVQCDCGSDEKLVSATSLTTVKATSCGCYSSEVHTSHGLTKDPWYGIAKGQQQRMTNPNHVSYRYYGGRGLEFGEGMETVAERILFYREYFGPAPPEGMDIDRIDNDRGYAKDNVRLATAKENNLNKRNTHGHTIRGEKTRTFRAWHNNKMAGRLCDEWAESSHQYLADIGGEIPEGKYLARLDMTRPLAPDNFYFSDKRQYPKRKHA